MIISTPSHLSYFPETLANTSQYLHFFLTIFITIESRLSLMPVHDFREFSVQWPVLSRQKHFPCHIL